MSDTWQRRPKRRPREHGWSRHAAFRSRACCGTLSREPHAPGCDRHPLMCGDKATFDRAGEAKQQARQHAIAVTDGSTTWRAYECPFCELYHLTTQPL